MVEVYPGLAVIVYRYLLVGQGTAPTVLVVTDDY